MSIHKSKGLEFDHVFVPSLEKGTRVDTKKLLNWDIYKNAKGKPYLLLAHLLPSHIESEEALLYDYLEQQEKEKAKNENIRLFYVACTRAKKSLYLFGNLKQKLNDKTGEISVSDPSSNSLLSLIWRNINKNPDTNHVNIYKYCNKKTPKEIGVFQSYKLKRIHSDWQNIPIFSSTPKNNEIDTKSSENNIENILKEPSPSAVLGTLVHACLKQFTELDSNKKHKNWIGLQHLEIYHGRWKKLINNEGIFDIQQIDNIIKSCEEVLNKTFSDETNAWIFDNSHQQSQCEQIIFFMENNTGDIDDLKQYVIDRSFISDGVRWIIDYKTSEPKFGQNINDFCSEQEKIYRQQLTAYAKCYQQLEKCPQKLALYFPRLGKLHCLDK